MKKVIVTLVLIIVVVSMLFAGCSSNSAEVNKLKAEKAELANTLETLQASDGAKDQEINDLKAEVEAKKQEVNDLKAELEAAEDEIANPQNQSGDDKDQIISKLQSDLKAKTTEAAELKKENTALQTQIVALQPKLKDPTGAEAVAFIKADKTNIEVPVDFAFAVMVTVNRAAQQGIKAYWVVAKIAAGGGYNLIGFKTTDEDWKYFVATADLEVKLVKGEKYSSINGFTPPAYDDTILDIYYWPEP